MNDQDRDQLDDLLTGTLARCLDPQRGRAAAAFARETPARRRRSRSRMLTIGGAGLLASAAAVAALAWALPGQTPQPQPERIEIAHALPSPEPTDRPDAAPATWPPEEYERITIWRAFDEGTVVLGGDTPFRQFRRFALEQTTWTDPEDDSTIAMTVPREDVVLVEMAVY